MVDQQDSLLRIVLLEVFGDLIAKKYTLEEVLNSYFTKGMKTLLT
jgi:hypothetical protein